MTKPTTIARDPYAIREAMTIVEKYETFLNYAYPKIQNCPRKHGVLRDAVLSALFLPVAEFNLAGKLKQLRPLYTADSQISDLRFWLRFLAHPSRQVINDHQCGVAMGHLDEVGRILGAWIESWRHKG